MTRLLVLDRGNDSLKGALIESDKIVRRWYIGREDEENLEQIIDSERPNGVAVSSVIGSWTVETRRILEAAGTEKVLFAGNESPLPFNLEVENPEKVGSDRLCVATAAAADGVLDAVMVDIGTAVTVDVLSKGDFIGGAIFPGLAMILRAMHEFTAELPLVLPQYAIGPPPGRDTVEAMKRGGNYGLIGGIERLIALSREKVGEQCPIFLTGGGAGLLEGSMAVPAIFRPDMVLDGLKILFRRKFIE
jgi:type III pantothenate kinase